MPDRMRFMIPLLLVLAGLSWAATEIMIRTSRRSLEHDVDMRAQLAIASAGRDLVRTWRVHDAGSIAWLLGQISRDERILSAAACSPSSRSSPRPPSFRARSAARSSARTSVRRRSRRRASGTAGARSPCSAAAASTSRCIRSSTATSRSASSCSCTISSFIDRRGARTRLIAFAGMAALALSASLLTLLIGRAVWRRWNLEMRRALHGDNPRPEFQPILNEIPPAHRRLQQRARQHHAVDRRAAQGHAAPPPRGREDRDRRQPRAVHPRARRRRRGARAASGQRPGHRARAGDARLLRRVGGARQRHAPTATPPIAHGRVGVPPEEKSYQIRRVWLTRRGGAGLLLRLLERGAVAAVPRRARAPALRQRRLGRTTSASTAASPRPRAPRRRATIRSSSCRTTTSRWRRA